MVYSYSSAEFEAAFTYDGQDLGAVWSKKRTQFRVWAPTASEVKLNLYEAGQGGAATRLTMTPSRQGTWLCSVPGDLEGVYYTFTATVDGVSREAADPYGVSAGVNGQRSMVLNQAATEPEGI